MYRLQRDAKGQLVTCLARTRSQLLTLSSAAPSPPHPTPRPTSLGSPALAEASGSFAASTHTPHTLFPHWVTVTGSASLETPLGKLLWKPPAGMLRGLQCDSALADAGGARSSQPSPPASLRRPVHPQRAKEKATCPCLCDAGIEAKEGASGRAHEAGPGVATGHPSRVSAMPPGQRWTESSSPMERHQATLSPEQAGMQVGGARPS